MSNKIIPSQTSTIDAENHIDKIELKNLDEVNNENVSGKQCRICLEQTYPLIVACKCTGTVKYVHEQCMMHWARQVIKKQQEEIYDQPLTSISCELCKQEIQLRIQWKDVQLSFIEAKKRHQDYFWPTIIVNGLIGLICLSCLCFVLGVLIMGLTQNSAVDYEKFKNDPIVTWGILIGSFLVGLVFLIKSAREIYLVFIKKQFRIDGIVYKGIVINEDKTIENKQNEKMNKQQYDLNRDKLIEIKCVNDLNISLEPQRQTISSYYPQQNPFNYPNVKSQREQSNANLIIPKIQSTDMNIKIIKKINNQSVINQ